MKKDSIGKNTLVLVIMTLILGAILGSVHYVTEKPIAAQEKKEHDEALEAVAEDAESFETVDLTKDGLDERIEDKLKEEDLTAETVDELNLAKDSSGETIGYVFTITTTEGYGGDIQFTLGLDDEGTITGISYLSISETAGLGMRATNESFINEFVGKQAEKIKYTKTGASGDDEIDALSGSTITTNAVTNGVNAGLAAYQVYTSEEGGA